MLNDLDKQNVYGETYNNSMLSFRMLDEAVNLQCNIIHKNKISVSEFAAKHLLDKRIYSNGKFYFASMRGELIKTNSDFIDYYGSALLYYDDEGKVKVFMPEGKYYMDNACLLGEESNALRKSLNHRNYFQPAGYYDDTLGTFNNAIPYVTFAKQTNRDTSYIYNYIEHIAGVCSPWLLRWLRDKFVHPEKKTMITPVIVSRVQGTGKSTLGTVLCAGIFGKDNVIVSDQIDLSNRFNSDVVDKLIVSIEEKDEKDKNSTSILKSRTTANIVRKEIKGVDAVFQKSYTEYIITSNKDVPIKFEDREDQRRFMVMEADYRFRKATENEQQTKYTKQAEELFNKLYGEDSYRNKVGIPFYEDDDLISQFKHELVSLKTLDEVNLYQFPKTPAYYRCFTLPRTNENTEIESIMRTLAPFIRESLIQKRIVKEINGSSILDFLSGNINAIQYDEKNNQILLARTSVFINMKDFMPFQHSTVERCIGDCRTWLNTMGIKYDSNAEPNPEIFYMLYGRNRASPVARFSLITDEDDITTSKKDTQNENYTEEKKLWDKILLELEEINGKYSGQIPNKDPPSKEVVLEPYKRLRVNSKFIPDEEGEFETVNPLINCNKGLKDKNNNVAYMKYMLFEADQSRYLNLTMIADKVNKAGRIEAKDVYKEILGVQKSEVDKLITQHIPWRVVYSGGKSYHILIKLKYEPHTLEEYRWLHSYICSQHVLSDRLEFDVSTRDPARLTRSPIKKERVIHYADGFIIGIQEIYYEGYDNEFNFDWRLLYEQWCNRPMSKVEYTKGKRIFPSKQIYIDAAEDLLTATFFTDNRWNGKRQETFFSAYRILRSIGWTHAELWADGGILDGLENYYKSNEINYWKTRENCKLIQEIDNDFDI